MSDPTPTIGEPQDEFELPPRPDSSLSDLVESADFDDVHFFIEEALQDDAIDVEPAGDDTVFALLPYEHPDDAIDCDTYDLVEQTDWEPATFRDLLNFAIERPGTQREYEVIALATLRTRRVFDDREGETVWDQTERDRSICQWATGLSSLRNQRTLIPVELYLDEVLRQEPLLLVRRS